MTTNEVRGYINYHAGIIAPLYKDYSVKLWNLSLDGNNEALSKALIVAKEQFLKIYTNREEFRQLQAWKAAGLQLDEIDARQLKLIFEAFVPNQIEEEVLHDIVERETHIENTFNTFRPN